MHNAGTFMKFLGKLAELLRKLPTMLIGRAISRTFLGLLETLPWSCRLRWGSESLAKTCLGRSLRRLEGSCNLIPCFQHYESRLELFTLTSRYLPSTVHLKGYPGYVGSDIIKRWRENSVARYPTCKEKTKNSSLCLFSLARALDLTYFLKTLTINKKRANY